MGDRLGLGVAETAAGIARVVDNNMATAARVHIAESGTDPLRYRMVAFGGAGPVHAYEIARLLNVRELIFPRGAGVASAIGMLVAPRSVEYTRSLIMRLDALDWGLVDETVAALEARGRAVLHEAGVGDAEIAVELSADMRYVGQGFEVTVPLDRASQARRDAAAWRRAFDAQYERRFGRSLDMLSVEAVSWRLRVAASAAVSELRFAEAGLRGGNALIERRMAFFEECAGFVDTPVFARDRLRPGAARIEGPALIEEAESTAVIGPRASVVADAHGNLVMTPRNRAAS
jgi:N-methylhydantoinase A